MNKGAPAPIHRRGGRYTVRLQVDDVIVVVAVVVAAEAVAPAAAALSRGQECMRKKSAAPLIGRLSRGGVPAWGYGQVFSPLSLSPLWDGWKMHRSSPSSKQEEEEASSNVSHSLKV